MARARLERLLAHTLAKIATTELARETQLQTIEALQREGLPAGMAHTTLMIIEAALQRHVAECNRVRSALAETSATDDEWR